MRREATERREHRRVEKHVVFAQWRHLPQKITFVEVEVTVAGNKSMSLNNNTIVPSRIGSIYTNIPTTSELD